MAESVRCYVPTTEFARSNTLATYFPDYLGNLVLNFDRLNWEVGVPDGSNICIIRVDADNRQTGGTVPEPIEWAALYLRNRDQYIGLGTQVDFKSTTSASYTGLTSRGVRTETTAGSPLFHINVSGGSTTNRYWQIEIQNCAGIAPQVELVMMGVIKDIQRRWNWRGDYVRDDRSISELTPGRSVMSRRVRRRTAMNIEQRIWEDIPDTDRTTMLNIFDRCGGPFMPFILRDYFTSSIDYANYRLVHFDPQTHGNRQGFRSTPTASDLNDMSITIMDAPSINYGDVL